MCCLCILNSRSWRSRSFILFFFFFNDTATTEIYTLSLHDALPILYATRRRPRPRRPLRCAYRPQCAAGKRRLDRKSTRLNSSHITISYAVFCLKKKKQRSNTEQIHITKKNKLKGT